MERHHKVAGIIAEFNPFHNGHRYLIEQTRKHTGADYIIVVMSGNYVQRGGPAIIDKFARTQMALEGGADLVIELPVIYATASANHFAEGAVDLLDQLHCIDTLVFGSECGNLEELSALADMIAGESESYRESLRHFLKSGLSYPAARSMALKECHFKEGGPDKEGNVLDHTILEQPNDVLGMEYLCALKNCQSSIKPYCIPRAGAGHHESAISPFTSASAIRRELLLPEESRSCLLSDSMMPQCYNRLMKYEQEQSFLYEDDFSPLLLPHFAAKEDFTKYYDISADLSNRMGNLSRDFLSVSQFTALLKRKNLTYSGISRGLFHCILNLLQKDHDMFFQNGKNYYIRVLGFRRDSSGLLKELKAKSSLPVITRLGKYGPRESVLSDLGLKMLSCECYGDELYRLIQMKKCNKILKDIREQQIVII